MSKEKKRQNTRIRKIKLLPRLAILFSIITGILISVFITVLIQNEHKDFDSWLNNSMFSALDAIDNIYASAQNEDYDIEYVWGKLINDFDRFGLLEKSLSTEDLKILKENLSINIEKTVLASFQYFVRNQRFQVNGFPFVVSPSGEVMIHPIDEGKNYSTTKFFQDVISSKTQTGEIKMQWPENRLGERRKLFFKKNLENNYVTFINIDEADYLSNLSKINRRILLIGGVFYLLVIVLFVLILKPIVSKIKAQGNSARQLFEEHKIPEFPSYFKDELDSINTVLENGQNYLSKLTMYIDQLKNQDYDSNNIKEIEDKLLAKKMLELKEELVKIKEKETKRKEELDLQNWIANGIAKFNDVLRKSSNLKEMGNDIVTGICEYMDINQSAIYNVEHNARTKEIETIRLIAAYAFDRQRTIGKTLLPGEGLVGAAIKEKKNIYLDKIPDDYIHITSGLGEAVPSHLLIIPLKREEEILGAIELASFKKIEEHEVKFLERLSQTFAISISNILVSDNTNKLLTETKEQAEKMASQEEEMRQTLEELQATQEEMQRKTKQMEQMNELHEEKEQELEATIKDLNNLMEKKNEEIANLKTKK